MYIKIKLVLILNKETEKIGKDTEDLKNLTKGYSIVVIVYLRLGIDKNRDI